MIARSNATTRMQQVADGEFAGMECLAVNFVMSIIPANVESREEIESLVREFALEACHEYDPSRGTEFSTFLMSALRWKVLKWKRKPSVTSVQEDAPFLVKGINLEGESGYFVPSAVATVEDNVSARMSMRSFLDSLSPESQRIFYELRDNSDVYMRGIKVLGWRRIHQITGKSRHACEKFIDEVKRKGVQHCESIAGN
jgi:hypothetical protein